MFTGLLAKPLYFKYHIIITSPSTSTAMVIQRAEIQTLPNRAKLHRTAERKIQLLRAFTTAET